MKFDLTISLPEIFAICAAIFTIWKYFHTKTKNRNLETLKYMSEIRKEIWDLVIDYYDKNPQIKTENKNEGKKEFSISKVDDETKRIIRQKIEYIAMAVRSGIFKKDIIVRLSGKWLLQIIEKIDVLSTDEEYYKETKRLYDDIKQS